MKQKIKLWAWRTLLSLTCLITASTAWASFNLYVKPYSSDYYIHTWGGTIQKVDGTTVTGSVWPGTLFNKNFDIEVIGGTTWYVIPVTTESISYIINVGSDQHQTGDLLANETKFVTYAENASDITDETSNYSKYLDTYYATGNNAIVFGTAWSATAKEMANDYNGTWTWTSEEFSMEENESIGFKVVKNGTDWIPSGSGNETTLTAPSQGTYKLTVSYTLNATAATGVLTPISVMPVAPTFSIASGTYDTNQNVTISCATDGATIYYTTDGSDPSTSSSVYSEAISLDDEGAPWPVQPILSSIMTSTSLVQWVFSMPGISTTATISSSQPMA